MSAGHAHSRRPNAGSVAELRKLTADPDFQRMRARPYTVVAKKQIPDSAGYNVLGTVYYIDVDLYQAIRSGTWTHPKTGKVFRVSVDGMTPDDVIHCLLEHEITEKCLLDGDNDISIYLAAHEFATIAEHLAVKQRGGRPFAYERALRPLIEWNQVKPLTDVPADLCCAPLLDDPDKDDKRTLKVLRGLGIADAFKVSKESVGYSRSTGADRCDGCAHWMAEQAVEIAPCEIVDGAVRGNWWCRKWAAEEKDDGEAQQSPSGLQSRGSEDRQGVGDQEPGGSAGGGEPEGQSGSEEGESSPEQGQRVT